MHSTQIYFEDQLFEYVKQKAKSKNISVAMYIQETVKKDLESKTSSQPSIDLSKFSGLWKDYDISIESIRKEAWK